MQPSSVGIANRAAALMIAALLSSSAIAAEKTSSGQAKADCASKANLQFSIDDANSFAYPAISPQFGQCRVQAQIKYGNAIAGCQTAALGTRPIGKLKYGAGATAPATTLTTN